MPYPDISEDALYRQVIQNTVNELEIIREAISNSVDAGATEFTIDLALNGAQYDLTMIDNGHGIIMENIGTDEEQNGFKALWGMGKSIKQGGAIGEKGLGSKTYFRANRVEVSSVYDGIHYHSYMANAMNALENGQMPQYYPDDNLTSDENTTGIDQGTKIVLRGVTLSSIRENQNAEDIAKRVKDYILWKTAAGTFKNTFHALVHLNQVPNIHNPIHVYMTITDNQNRVHREDYPGTHPFARLNANPRGQHRNDHGIYENSLVYCQPFEGDYIDPQNNFSWQVKGTVSGKNPRRAISHFNSGETMKARFGIYLCKDFIPIQKHEHQSLISNEYYFACHVMLNCQEFELDASRNKITNLDSLNIQAMLTHFGTWWNQNVGETYLTTWRNMVKQEETDTATAKKVLEMQQMRDEYPSDQLTDLDSGGEINHLLHSPTNEYTTAILFAMMIQSDLFQDSLLPIRSISQHIDKSTDMIALNQDGNPILVELEHTLPNLFSHKHPLESYDVVVVWSLGGAEHNQQWPAPWQEGNLNVKLNIDQQNNCTLRWGGNVSRPVIVLQHILEEYVSNQKEPANP